MNSEPIYLISGISVSKNFYDLAEVTFPDNIDTPFKALTSYASREMVRVLELRWLAAVSGAMRWPESQEAMIHRKAYSKIDYA